MRLTATIESGDGTENVDHEGEEAQHPLRGACLSHSPVLRFLQQVKSWRLGLEFEHSCD